MPITDVQADLLRRAQQGDALAMEALLREVQPQLYRFSMKMCRHSADAEDVLQNSLMAMARTLRDFRGEASLSTWLFTIARRFCIKQRRKSKFAPSEERTLHDEAAELPAETPSPHDLAESAEVWAIVQQAIAALEPAYREVLVLRDIEGLSAKEVAQVVELSVPAVKSRLHRARAQLRERLALSPYAPAPGCPNIREVFSKHLEGDLSASVCSTMEAHVAECPVCAAECDGLRSALAACSAAPCEVPEAVQNRVRESLRQAIFTAPR